MAKGIALAIVAAGRRLDAVGTFVGRTLAVAITICCGVLRDIACAQVPAALDDHPPNAACAFAGGWVVVLTSHLGLQPQAGLAAGFAVSVTLRAWAIVRDVRLPARRAASDVA